jgi:hypothetical protein
MLFAQKAHTGFLDRGAPSPKCSFTLTEAVHNGMKDEQRTGRRVEKCLLVGGVDCTAEDMQIWGHFMKMPLCPKPEVLLFGALNDKRTRTCRAVGITNFGHGMSANRTVGCVKVFGEAKEELICEADIVFVEHFYDGASLEVHRINPLLQAGKVVEAVSSGDKLLDSEYADVVVFASSSETLPATIAQVVRAGGFANKEHRAREFARERTSDLTPLCNALQQLNGHVTQQKRTVADAEQNRRTVEQWKAYQYSQGSKKKTREPLSSSDKSASLVGKDTRCTVLVGGARSTQQQQRAVH